MLSHRPGLPHADSMHRRRCGEIRKRTAGLERPARLLRTKSTIHPSDRRGTWPRVSSVSPLLRVAGSESRWRLWLPRSTGTPENRGSHRFPTNGSSLHGDWRRMVGRVVLTLRHFRRRLRDHWIHSIFETLFRLMHLFFPSCGLYGPPNPGLCTSHPGIS